MKRRRYRRRPSCVSTSGNSILPLVLLGLVLSAAPPVRGEPGELYQKRRQAVIAAFDRNGDGRLDAQEREAVRADQKMRALQNSGRNAMFQPPPEVVALYDKDGDGRLNEEESVAASEGIRRSFEEASREYDLDHDGDLNEAERERLGSAILAGKVPGLPRIYGSMLRRPPGGQRGGMFRGRDAGESPLARFDTDRDGRLSESELAAARKAGMGNSNKR